MDLIKKLERPGELDQDRKEGKDFFEKMLKMAENPFIDWSVSEEGKRLCDVGDEQRRGWMCDCSS
jgi:hypothetical protein